MSCSLKNPVVERLFRWKSGKAPKTQKPKTGGPRPPRPCGPHPPPPWRGKSQGKNKRQDQSQKLERHRRARTGLEATEGMRKTPEFVLSFLMASQGVYDGLAVSEIFVLRTAPAAALWGTPRERPLRVLQSNSGRLRLCPLLMPFGPPQGAGRRKRSEAPIEERRLSCTNPGGVV